MIELERAKHSQKPITYARTMYIEMLFCFRLVLLLLMHDGIPLGLFWPIYTSQKVYSSYFVIH